MDFIIIDKNTNNSIPENTYYTWNGLFESDNVHPLIKIIEDNGDFYKNRYIDWVYNVANSNFKNKSIINYFEINENFSYWWLMPISEKSIWKSPQIFDIIKLMLIEDIILTAPPKNLIFKIDNLEIHKILSNFCKARNISYLWEISLKKKILLNIHFIYKVLSPFFLGVLSFINFIIINFSFFFSKKYNWKTSYSIFFCSYFFNLDQHELENNNYVSKYWDDLQKKINSYNINTNWLHIYIKNKVTPNIKSAFQIQRIFNKKKTETHNFIFSFLSPKVVLDVLSTFIKINLFRIPLNTKKEIFNTLNSEMNFWPLLQKEWYHSFLGPIAVSNIFNHHLLKYAIKSVPRQTLGFYIFEDQSWERSFVFFWKKYGHSELNGVAHSTVRFWDLRYSTDSRLISPNLVQCPLPFPNYILLNGINAIKNYKSANHFVNLIRECEAIRFINISENAINKQVTSKKIINLLILGDYINESSNYILSLLDKATHKLNFNIEYTYKPHPGNINKINKFSNFEFIITNEPLNKIINSYDLVFASNETSAAIDAYFSNTTLIIALDDNRLNLSPLRNEKNVSFISNFEELAFAINNYININNLCQPKNYFFLNKDLPRWEKILLNYGT
jgi:surface carbohydrate biosynthesis protein (TIGR04326 family)